MLSSEMVSPSSSPVQTKVMQLPRKFHATGSDGSEPCTTTPTAHLGLSMLYGRARSRESEADPGGFYPTLVESFDNANFEEAFKKVLRAFLGYPCVD